MTKKLTIELVPSTCWFSNVRSAVSKKQWNNIKKIVTSQAWDVCEICGGVGPKHPVECHEIWDYDDVTHIQKLIGMIALCPDCHMVKHFGLAQIQGKEKQALNHLMKVNSLSKKEAQTYINKAFATWQLRSSHDWTLDISFLKNYGIDLEIEER